MRMRTIVMILGAVVAMASTPGGLSAQSSTVRCESSNGSRVQCAIPSSARVELSKQLSSTLCTEGQNWGTSATFIWVNAGCRADFAVTTPRASQAIPANRGLTSAELRACRNEGHRQLPTYSAKEFRFEMERRTGNTDHLRWTTSGHKGTCEVSGDGVVKNFTSIPRSAASPGTEVSAATLLTCESENTERQECKLPSGSRARLVKQLSTNPCRLNDTYGTGQGYVWVDKGCRGEFEVSSTTNGGYHAGKPALANRITCESRSGERTECRTPFKSRVTLFRQISTTPCRENDTWGSTTSAVWVTKGCRAEFLVEGAGTAK